MKFLLSLNRCPIHKDFQAIMLDYRDENGNGHGTRLTRSKCCGQWETIKEWPLTKTDLLAAVDVFENAAEDCED